MNNEALHIKQRPSSFNQIIGNDDIVNSLESIVNGTTRAVPHVYLFQGISGGGKTTLARILASELGCPAHRIIEKNSADMTGVDDARDMLKTVGYKNPGASVKVYILDEVHMTTKNFQNALLKILEDTPAHVYFMLCTTEPDKLIKAVRNRCSIYQVEPLNEKQIKVLLKRTIKKEEKDQDTSFKMKKEHYELIADVTEGSPRQALIVLDQIMWSDSEERSKMIKEYKTVENVTLDLCRALMKGNWKEISGILKGLSKENPENIRYAVLGYFNAVLLNSGKERAATVIVNFESSFMYSKQAGLTLACFNSTQG